MENGSRRMPYLMRARSRCELDDPLIGLDDPLIGLDDPLIGEWIEAHALPDEGTEQVRA